MTDKFKTYEELLEELNRLRLESQSLHDRERQLDTILSGMPDVVFIHKEGIILYANQAACDSTEYLITELIGSHVLDYVIKEHQSMVVQKMKQRSAGENVGAYECGLMTKSGSIRTAIVKTQNTFFNDEEAVLFILHDITERQKGERLLKESEDKYRVLVQYASDPIFSVNPDGTYRYVNEAFAKRAGFLPDEIIGKTLHDIYPYDKAEERLKLIQQVLSTGEKGELEYERIISDEVKYYLTRVDPIKDEFGVVGWVTCISIDITERRVMEEELKKKNKELEKTNSEKDKLFSIIAHDLRSPFFGLIGLSEILAKEGYKLSPEEVTEYSNDIYSSTMYLYKLLENLLLWAQFQKGSISYKPKALSLSDVFAESLNSVNQRGEQKGILFQNEIYTNLKIYADENMIDCVLRNLLSNAVKFTGRGGAITIKAEKIGNGMVEISIADTGIGISKENAGKIFKLGEKVGMKGTDGEPSTGLGLILCKEFVEKHGGTIRVESEEGKGSTFYITIPGSN